MSVWFGELHDKLVELNAKAMSSSQIAREINSLYDRNFTRSAIIGARHRAGLTIPDKSTWTLEQRLAYGGGGYRQKSARPKESQRGKWVRVKAGRLAPPYSEATTIEDLSIPFAQRETLSGLTSKNCHWPVGDPLSSDFFFCGGVAVEDRPYCAGHCKVAYVKPSRPNPNFRLQNLISRV